MPGCNEENCTCANTECERHGKCCECINYHRQLEKPSLVCCLRPLVEKQDPSPQAR